MVIRGVRQRKGVTAGAIAAHQQPQLRSREGDPTRRESLDWTSASRVVTMPFRPFGADVRSAMALLDQRKHDAQGAQLCVCAGPDARLMGRALHIWRQINAT